jgi:hypothetical protein
MSASMLDRFPSPQEEEQSQSPATPSRKDEQNGSAPRHRKAASTGGGRAWTEEEVSNTRGLTLLYVLTKEKGVVPFANTQQQNALQTHRSTSPKD